MNRTETPEAADGSDADRTTVAEFQRAPSTVGRSELVRGRVVREPPAGGRHGWHTGTLHVRLARHVEEHDLGLVLAAETGFELRGDPEGTVRAPDVAFVSSDRVPDTGIPEGFWPGPPDLAVEIVSPSDVAGKVLEKVFDFLRAGCRMVWVVHPRTRSVTVYRSPSRIRVLEEDDVLTGEDVVPGFRVIVGELFRR